MRDIHITGCEPVAVGVNADDRGCLFEVFREEWPGAFRTVQWNVCASRAGVLRGVHVHVDYAEFYTLPKGRVFIALRDIRRESPTFGCAEGFEWAAADGMAIPVPPGVAHAVYFLEDSVLAFGLSAYWRKEFDVVGCQWQELAPSIAWPVISPAVSCRDEKSGSFDEMVRHYESLRATMGATLVAAART